MSEPPKKLADCYEAESLANCSHTRSFPVGEIAQRCSYCGSMKVGDGPWVFPHLVNQLVIAWKAAKEIG